MAAVAAGTATSRQQDTTYTLDDGDALDQWQQSASLDNRVALQASVTWSGLQDGSIAAGANDPANPYNAVWWLLQPVRTQHCGDCVDLAVKSPYDPPWAGAGSNQLNQTPGDGQTECGAGCHCELDYKANRSEVDALAAAAAWQVWLGQAGADLAAMQQIGTAAGYEPGDYSGYISQDVWEQIARDTAAAAQNPGAVSSLNARANAYTAQQIGTGAGYGPGFSLRLIPRRIPVLTGGDTTAETTSAPAPATATDTLTTDQQSALDRFRDAVAGWNAVRGDDLPEALRLFASEVDAYGALGLGGLPPYDQLTDAQQQALGNLVGALWDWADANGYLDDYGAGGGAFSEPVDDATIRLGLPGGGQPQGYSQPRGPGGKWAPGLGRQQEHEAAGGRAGGLRGPAGEMHARGAQSSGGGAAGGDAAKGENPDAKPFTHEEFLAAQLEPITGRGGHQPVFSTVMGGHAYFVKSYKNTHNEYEQPVHEVAARAIAKEVGLEHETIPVWLEQRDGVTYGVFPLVSGKSVFNYKRQDGVRESETYRYLPDNIRQRMGLYAYVIGEPDRVSPNFLVNPSTREVYSIDHTRAFGRQTGGESRFQAAYFRQGIGNGKLDSWKTVEIPRDELRQMVSHTERVAAIAEGLHVHGGGEPVRDRLTILRSVLDGYANPTYADILTEAKRLGRRPYQKSWEYPPGA